MSGGTTARQSILIVERRGTEKRLLRCIALLYIALLHCVALRRVALRRVALHYVALCCVALSQSTRGHGSGNVT